MEGGLAKLAQSSLLSFTARSSLALHRSRRVRVPSVLLHSGSDARRAAYDALLLDAGGTLLQLAKPVEETYASIGAKYGRSLDSSAPPFSSARVLNCGFWECLAASPADIKRGFKRAFSAPWPEKLRYQGDGRPFWRLVVSEATGCADHDYFEEVYQYYADGNAWHLPAGAYETMSTLKDAGVKLAVVSNFDIRLRKLLKDLNIVDLFDAVIVSSEVGYEKPDPGIFKAALDQLQVEPSRAIHIGDDEKADKYGAAVVGIECWLWGRDVKTFSDILNRMLIHV